MHLARVMRYSRKLSAVSTGSCQTRGKLFKIQSRCAAPPNPRRESAGSSYAPQQPADASRHNCDASQHRQLFDPRKHDTVSFSSAQARKPAQKFVWRLPFRLFRSLLHPLGRPVTTLPSLLFPLTPTRSSGDYPSVSSVSSYAHSVVSSNFTLSSGTTDGSSAPSSIFDHNKPRNEPQDECVFEPAEEALLRYLSSDKTSRCFGRTSR
ncbi:hypothetical protein V8E52_008792 [Russula decolorans]